MRRRWDIVIDVGELLLEAGVIEIQVLSDRYVLYGQNKTILDVIVDGACKVIKAFLKGQKVTNKHNTFKVTDVVNEAFKERKKEVDLAISKIKSPVVNSVPDEYKDNVSLILDKELSAKL